MSAQGLNLVEPRIKIEIERKFLVDEEKWAIVSEGMVPLALYQGYLSKDKDRVVRIRAEDGGKGYITVKGPNVGLTRPEYEYEIPCDDALYMLKNLCIQPIIKKQRYSLNYWYHTWSVDLFENGLMLAEIELDSESESFERPDWLGEEVSNDPRYFNSNM